jgi:hypothetical protein
MDSYYPDSGSSDDPMASNDTPSPADETENNEEAGAGESALIPKALLAGKHFDPGDELTLKIVALHGDDVEVEYATGKDDEGKEGETPMSDARKGIGDRMQAMADVPD